MKGCLHNRKTEPTQGDLIEIEIFQSYLSDCKRKENGSMDSHDFNIKWHDYERPDKALNND